VWDARTGRLVRHMHARTTTVSSCGFSPSGRLVVATSLESVQIWDPDKERMLWEHRPHRGLVTNVVFADESTVVTGGYDDGEVAVWDVSLTERALGRLDDLGCVLPFELGPRGLRIRDACATPGATDVVTPSASPRNH
jgi:WD40 repeat protein